MLSRLDNAPHMHISLILLPQSHLNSVTCFLFSMCSLSPQGESCIILVHWHLLSSSQKKQDHLLPHQFCENSTLNSLYSWRSEASALVVIQLWSVKLPSKIRDSIQYKIIQKHPVPNSPWAHCTTSRSLQRGNKLKALFPTQRYCIALETVQQPG